MLVLDCGVAVLWYSVILWCCVALWCVVMWRVPAGKSENTTRFLKSVSKKIKSSGFDQNAD